LSKFTMKILRKLLTLAVQDTNKFEQSLDAEIENLHTIARLSAQYPDLPLSLIESLINSMKEKAFIDFTFNRNEQK